MQFTCAAHTDYMGFVSMTNTRQVCQAWTADLTNKRDWLFTFGYMFVDGSLSAATNYCRESIGSGYVWCYVLHNLPGIPLGQVYGELTR